MARLTEKTSKAEGSRGAGSIPDFPKFAPRLANAPGGQETNAAIQRWNDLMKRRWVLLGEDLTRKFSIVAGFNDSVIALTARIETEESVRASADSALALATSTLEATVTTGLSTLTASVSTLSSAMATANGYLEARWTIQVTAGPIVTGMTLFSASGADTDVSYIAFQADRFQVNTASGGNKQIFSATATAVKLGDVLTVDLSAKKVFIGVGSYANSNTAFYVDDSANFSLGDKLSWNGTVLTILGAITATVGAIGGWSLGVTTISSNDAVLSSTGYLALGTSNNIVYLSAIDATYRLWIGNATAASASFSVTKAGALFSNSGTIGGFTIGASSLVAGSGASYVSVNASASLGFIVGDYIAGHTYGHFLSNSGTPQLNLVNASSATVAKLSVNSGYGELTLGETIGTNITLRGDNGNGTFAGTVEASGFNIP